MWDDGDGGRTYVQSNNSGEKRHSDQILELILAKKPKRVTIIEYWILWVRDHSLTIA